MLPCESRARRCGPITMPASWRSAGRIGIGGGPSEQVQPSSPQTVMRSPAVHQMLKRCSSSAM